MKIWEFGVVTIILALSGCTYIVVKEEQDTTREVTPVQFKDAVKQMVEGLEALHEEAIKDNTEFGLLPAEVTATFNIKVTSKGEDKVSMEIAPQMITEIAKIGPTFTAALGTERGNQITIKLKNIHFEEHYMANPKAPKIIYSSTRKHHQSRVKPKKPGDQLFKKGTNILSEDQ